MFTRVVQVTTKSGKAREVCNTIRDKALPILKNQNGFVDEFTLVSTAPGVGDSLGSRST